MSAVPLKKKKEKAKLWVYFPSLMWGVGQRVGVITDHGPAACKQVTPQGEKKCGCSVLRAECTRCGSNSMAAKGGKQTAAIILQVPLEVNPCS